MSSPSIQSALQQMQAGWQQTEAAARAQLLGDKEAATRPARVKLGGGDSDGF